MDPESTHPESQSQEPSQQMEAAESAPEATDDHTRDALNATEAVVRYRQSRGEDLTMMDIEDQLDQTQDPVLRGIILGQFYEKTRQLEDQNPNRNFVPFHKSMIHRMTDIRNNPNR